MFKNVIRIANLVFREVVKILTSTSFDLFLEVVLSCFSHVRLSVTLWTITLQAPLSMGFSGQEYWSELPGPPPGALPNPGIESSSLIVFCTRRWVLYH